MTASGQTVRVSADNIPIRKRGTVNIAVMGTPNCGKSTLFNRLTGLSQRIANFPGVTVERHVGSLQENGRNLELIDLPGTHSLSGYSQEERVAVDVLFGRAAGQRQPDGILAVVDATNLYQGLYLVQQLLELKLPLVVALTMGDAADSARIAIDHNKLGALLGGAPIFPVVATTGSGIAQLRSALGAIGEQQPVVFESVWSELNVAARKVATETGFGEDPLKVAEVSRTLVDLAHNPEAVDLRRFPDATASAMKQQVGTLFDDGPALAQEARIRYRWIRDVLDQVQSQGSGLQGMGTRVSQFFSRPIPGTLSLFVVMAIVFQAVFAWATPLMDLIDGATGSLSALAVSLLGEGALGSLVADGIIAGVGSVIIFLPQIVILFLFILLLEDSGYLARAAYLLDRVMRMVGLSGQSIIPMISSFACAVPGIMATRVIPSRRDRIATIMAAPFMTCSARLPVYALLISAFVPASKVGFLNVQGLVLLGLYLFGIVMGILTALLMRKTAVKGEGSSFALMLPEFRMPNVQTVLIQLLGRVKIFLRRAGTMIFAVTVIVWALVYFPRADLQPMVEQQQSELSATLSPEARAQALESIDNQAAAAQLEQSWLGRAGRAVAPAFAPLGWDWKITAAVIASFPAREVVVAVLGTIYAVGDEAEEATLAARLKSSTHADGSLVFTFPVVLGLLIFYALCLQCAATLAVIRRETNSWRWPIFAWGYMTSLGYLGALLVYQLGSG
ncbi:MAG: ferrous iron transport protein B [Lysobacterales bacterium]